MSADKRQIKRDMCHTVALLIDSYTGVGQPWSEHGCEPDECDDCKRKLKALEELRKEMHRRGWRKS